MGVSILVLLDQPLRHSRNLWYDNAERCFNPCFIGLASATHDNRRVVCWLYGVSILVLLDQPLRPAEFVDCRCHQFVFQSLFYWISLCDGIPWNSTRLGSVCFNPCFIGLASATRSYDGIIWRWFLSFNPCFIGLASATDRTGMPRQPVPGVSILVLLDQPLRQGRYALL